MILTRILFLTNKLGKEFYYIYFEFTLKTYVNKFCFSHTCFIPYSSN